MLNPPLRAIALSFIIRQSKSDVCITLGLTRQELDAAYERTKLDKMSTLDNQLNWLQESGFKDVDCVYKYFNFVVLFGRKN